MNKKWLSTYDPSVRRNTVLKKRLSMLLSVEDDFVSHPATKYSVEIDHPEFMIWNNGQDLTYKILTNFIKEHKLNIINFGIGDNQKIVVNFTNKTDAAQFKILWRGWES